MGGCDNTKADVPGRMYFMTVEELADKLGCDAATLRKTIEDYDAYVMGTADSLEVEKLSAAAARSARLSRTRTASISRKRTSSTRSACASWRRLPTTPWAA